MIQVKQWAKKSPNPIARLIRSHWQQLNALELPSIPVVHGVLYRLHKASVFIVQEIMRRAYWSPMFKSQINGGDGLYLYSGMPMIIKPLRITLGRHCRISGISTFCGRWSSQNTPELIVGDNVDIGWQTTIAVAGQVVLEDNVRMAGKVFLAGYPGHPVNPYDRAEGAPDLDSQTGDIIIRKNAWIGTGVTVLPGVTIGENSIIGTGSIVTQDIPPNVIAAGNPARPVRSLTSDELARNAIQEIE